jgi:hypothetical protein
MTEDTKTLYQEFVDCQRQRAVTFLEECLEMVETNTRHFTTLEKILIFELDQFTRIPNPCSRHDLAEQLEFQLNCMERRGQSNPKVTYGEKRLFKMVNAIRLMGDVA